jgi:hypothetical protein
MGTLDYKLKLNIIDDFYDSNDFYYMTSCSMLNPFNATYQPNNNFFTSRTNAYSCHESKVFTENDKALSIFAKTFSSKTGINIKKVVTFFRKIYASEITNILKYGCPSHKDNIDFNIAGVIYYNSFGLDDGTGLFTTEGFQIEPDIIIGAKPNRCVFYDTQISHKPLQSKNNEVRIIQPFFIKYE